MALNYTNFDTVHDFVDYVSHGRWLDAIFGTYYNLIGGYFILFFFAFTFFLLYVKTRSLGLCSVVIIVLAGGMALVLPVAMLAQMFVIMAFGIGAFIASIYLSRR